MYEFCKLWANLLGWVVLSFAEHCDLAVLRAAANKVFTFPLQSSTVFQNVHSPSISKGQFWCGFNNEYPPFSVDLRLLEPCILGAHLIELGHLKCFPLPLSNSPNQIHLAANAMFTIRSRY